MSAPGSADAAALAGAVRRRGTELGLLRVGFAAPHIPPVAHGSDPAPGSSPGFSPDHPVTRFARWIAAGHHGEMGYLARRQCDRADTSRLLSGVRSVVVASEVYFPPGTAPDASPDASPGYAPGYFADDVFAEWSSELADSTRGYFARYARGADYHHRLGKRLEALAAFIGALAPGSRNLVYVDTGPILEKAHAVAAGIGWQGKHSNLVDPTAGNWVALGVILSDVAFPPDAPQPDRCGTCTDCLDVCPTSAFAAPYVLDARRCISYLTIELKGPIPPELRPAIGNRVFGCDDCLAVCPWNRFAQAARDTAYAARTITAGTPLVQLMALTPEGFDAAFRGTPVHRTGRGRLLRNVAVALGNGGDTASVPVLTAALNDPEPLIREHALWALQTIQGGRPPKALA